MEAWEVDFGFCLPIPSTHPSLCLLPAGAVHTAAWVSGVAQGHRRPVMTGKGSKITQDQCCSIGVGCLLFGPCLPKQIL